MLLRDLIESKYRTCVGVVGKAETHTTIRPVYSNSVMKCQAHQKNGISEKKYKYYTPFVSKMHWRLSRSGDGGGGGGEQHGRLHVN